MLAEGFIVLHLGVRCKARRSLNRHLKPKSYTGLQTPSVCGQCLLTTEPARETTLCLLCTFCHGLVKLVNFSLGLCAGLNRGIVSLFATLGECLLGIVLALLKPLLRVGSLYIVSF